MEKLKLWLDAYICSYKPQTLALSSSRFQFITFLKLDIWCRISIQTLLFWATLPTRQDGGWNREKAYYFPELTASHG